MVKSEVPEASSSRLTTSPFFRSLDLTHSFGSDTIIVEPPVTWSLRNSLSWPTINLPRFVASTFHDTYALNIDYSEIYINTYCNVKSNGQPYGLDTLPQDNRREPE